MSKSTRFELVQDIKGVKWDLLLYIPTLIALVSIASQFWFNGEQNITYLLVFMTTMIFLIAFNRIAKTRLMILPSSAIALDVSNKAVRLELKSGEFIEMIKGVRFFSDTAGKSIGLSGLDGEGKKQQQVFHKGQFVNEEVFSEAKALLRVFR